MRKRSWMLFVALGLCCTLLLPTPALGAKSFSDTKGHWAVTYITDLANKGYINGYPDGTFKPDKTMTRAEFTTALIISLDVVPGTPSGNSYSDTKTHWARKYIEEAVERGILVPSESPKGLGPDDSILRSQAAAMLVRALELAPSSGALKFTDADQVERSLYRDHVKAAYDAGIISGFPDGSFEPFREMTRAQVCTVLIKMLDKKGTTPVVQPVTGSITTLAVGEDLFTLGTIPFAFRANFTDTTVARLAVDKDALTVNDRYVYALNRSASNPDVVIGNTCFGVSKMTVNGDKLVIFPANRRIANFELDGYKYNSDYIKLFVNSRDDGLYLADMEVVDENNVLVKGEEYSLSGDKITIEVNEEFFDITQLKLSPGSTVPRLEETDPVVFRGMSLSDISAIFVDTDTIDVDDIDSLYFIINGKRYRLSDVSMDASAAITVAGKTYEPDDVVLTIDDINYSIDHISYMKGKFIFYCEEGEWREWVMFNNSYLDYSDITILKGTTAYDMEDVLVVERNLVRIGSREYTEDDIQCRVDGQIWDITRIEWSKSLDMVVITAKKAEDSYYSDQPEDYIFYDEDGNKIYQGIDDDVLIYLGGKWVSFEDVLMSGPSSCTYSGKTYSIIGVRMKVDGDTYLVDETSWSSSGILRVYLEEY